MRADAFVLELKGLTDFLSRCERRGGGEESCMKFESSRRVASMSQHTHLPFQEISESSHSRYHIGEFLRRLLCSHYSEADRRQILERSKLVEFVHAEYIFLNPIDDMNSRVMS